MNDTAKNLIESFFRGMQIEIKSLSIEIEAPVYTITLETPDSALVIGMHGLALDSIKHLLGRMLDSLTESHTIIHLEVNDYMKQHDEKLYRYLDGRVSYAMHS
jgi:predicted RNA-binding protein Jag